MTTDPFGQYHSPYLGMGNDPVNTIDPSGGICGSLLGFTIAGFTMNFSSVVIRASAPIDPPKPNPWSTTKFGSEINGGPPSTNYNDFNKAHGIPSSGGIEGNNIDLDLLLGGYFLVRGFAGGAISLAATPIAEKAIVAGTSEIFLEELAVNGIRGFTKHGVEQMAARGFTKDAVLKIIKDGSVKEVLYNGSPQIHYVLGKYSIVTEITGRNAGKIISLMGDYEVIGINNVRGIFTGF